jgi:hypothetical protein
MFIIIRYSDGSHVEGVVHRLERGTLRATVAGIDDAVEYILFEDGWTSEHGDDVTFEFTVQREAALWSRTTGAREPGCAAGGDCVLRRTAGTGGSVLVN